MKKQIKEKFPLWCKDKESNYELIMSDDVDSLMCYIFQNKVFKREVKYFMDMSSHKAYQSKDKKVTRDGKQILFSSTDASFKKNKILGLDFSIDKDIKCWDNHVVKIHKDDTYNSLSANLNVALDIRRYNYTKKGCLSSFITMLSYYNIDITKWDKDQLAILSCIDSTYEPFFTSFKETGKHNLELLEYGFLVDFIKENITYIKKIEQKLNLKNGKIWVNKESGLLETNINLEELGNLFGITIELPKAQFNGRKLEFQSKIFNFANNQDKASFDKEIFNIALLYKNSGIVSFI